MLMLLAKNIDICRISQILSLARLKSVVTKSTIIIDSSEITENVVNSIFENTTIIRAQNYYSEDFKTYIDTVEKSEEDIETEVSIPVEEETSVETEETVQYEETVDSEYYVEEANNVLEDPNEDQQLETKPTKISEEEMVYRGEVYKLKSAKKDAEGSIKECVIIIQNDYENSASDDTIALFCTSHFEEKAPIRFSFQLMNSTMIDHSCDRLGYYDRSTLFVCRIKGINRKDLGEYLGTMNGTFMNTVQPTIDYCLGLKRSRTVNWAQLQILSTVDMKELFAIAESKIIDSMKVDEYLKLFGFDFTKTGVEYVKDAILIAKNLSDYRLENLAEKIAKRKNVEASEVLRLIVARIKEKFNFSKSPAISFIRLIERLLKKG